MLKVLQHSSSPWPLKVVLSSISQSDWGGLESWEIYWTTFRLKRETLFRLLVAEVTDKKMWAFVNHRNINDLIETEDQAGLNGEDFCAF